MTGEYIFSINGLSKTYGSKKVFENIHLHFYHGAKIGIVGENGAGKSTLLRIMAGVEKEFDGTATPLKGTSIGYLAQEPELPKDKTVRQAVEEAFSAIKNRIDEFNAISAKMAEPMDDDEMTQALEKMGRLQDEIDAADGWELDRQIDKAMDALVLPRDDQIAGTLSGGEARRVALCRLLLQKPDILLLDEPTNHLDAETVEWLEATLKDFPGNVIVSTHDRYFLDHITKWILELSGGKGIPFEGNYSKWLEKKYERQKQKEKTESSLAKRLAKELEWINKTPSARRSKNKSRIQDYDKLLNKKTDDDPHSLEIQIAPGPPLGEKVIVAESLSKGYGGTTLFQNLDFSIPRGAIVGMIGPNGTGKTTLFKLIVGDEKPDEGSIEAGQSVVLSYVDQHRHDLNPENTLFEEISGGDEVIEIAGRSLNARSYVGRFNFKGSDQQKKVGSLSGGERNRVHLAKLLRRGGNVLLLDEPTNDLDVSTLSNLENALLEFPGVTMVISHDRFFLDRIATHLLVFEGEEKVRFFEGNFEAYLETRKKETGGNDEKRRSRYKKLTLS